MCMYLEIWTTLYVSLFTVFITLSRNCWSDFMACEYIFNYSSLLLHLASWEESEWPLCCRWEAFLSPVSRPHFCLWSDSKAVPSSFSTLAPRWSIRVSLSLAFLKASFLSHFSSGLYLLWFHIALWSPMWGRGVARWLWRQILQRTLGFKSMLCRLLAL